MNTNVEVLSASSASGVFFGLLLGILPIVSQTGVLWLQGNTSQAVAVFGASELFS